jgi:MerR family transcriptional regulator, light-induced transcriptional regulator
MTYPIQVVVRETGLSAHVLRVWEKRYRAVVPQRTETQRRVYADADVQRLKLLRQATLLGHPIGSIANLPDEALQTLVKAAAARAPIASPRPVSEGAPVLDAPIILDCIDAIRAFDADAFNTLLERTAVEMGHTALMRQVLTPLVQRLGDFWSQGILRMAHEHFATVVIRSFLLNPARQYAGVTATATLVVSTPQGQLHELGAVMASALASEQGWHSVYLGPSLPAAEIAGIASQSRARAVALSIVYPDDDPNVEHELHDLRRFLPGNIAIIAGGRAVEHYHAALVAIGAIIAKDLAQLQIELAKIRATRPLDHEAVKRFRGDSLAPGDREMLSFRPENIDTH